MARIIRKVLILFGVVAALLILLLILTTLHEPKFVPATMPNPNGYDDLLFAAGKLMITLAHVRLNWTTAPNRRT